MEIKNIPMVLVILDGWGLRAEEEGNAIARARTPHMDHFWATCPHTTLGTSGEDVGLPDGQMGNSEVGHLNIGAGRIVYQELTRITRAIRDGSFFTNKALVAAVEHVQATGGALHLMGLLSDGGVHSHISHLFALLELARKHNLSKVYIHCFLDGRDVPPDNAGEYIQQLEEKCRELGTGIIATVMGRYYAMDRDRRWDRTRRAYEAMVLGKGLTASSAMEALEGSYRRGETDEFVQPTVITRAGAPVALVESGDAVIFYNFRPDRARQITRAFVDEDFTGFERPANRPRVHFTCMTLYDKTINAPVAFEPHHPANTLGEVISRLGLRQLRLAETEKYAHVTFFFNGGVETPYPGEDRLLIPSPKVATYDQKPEMSAPEVTEAFLEQLASGKYQVIIMNYANADMVGHTGDMDAAIKAIETVDRCVGKVVKAVQEKGGTVIITADHGNADEMLDPNGHPHTAHTTNRAPFILIGEDAGRVKLRPGGILADIAPTMLDLMGIPVPPEMTGRSLILERWDGY
ncbi:2,3-bisphosphoglycerate-independent phosphoglycerate mutase [Desulfofundulus thermocisternus]|uniref:2,3-bisphosphoglycerate-independent phosphoglycerate mutase n=1 Tax=Desulfofundulus thermocisternus TaxID=42471 RepID=UPI00217D052B|nr:2,3-bisphosphoglycerate-independent phosphoglycerate mutase [Desulfofundulus thermocisternus]MCS5696508.1 2,3-bisphosphoglycerate-independent phosphoglycerate mutase [Desulfofundulus thermocisternus]